VSEIQPFHGHHASFVQIGNQQFVNLAYVQKAMFPWSTTACSLTMADGSEVIVSSIQNAQDIYAKLEMACKDFVMLDNSGS
jgi:hypothetical protein